MRRPRLSEAEFQSQVIQLAHLCGWNAYHTRDSRGSSKGLPDLLLLRERTGEAVWVELKVPPRTLTAEQAVVIQRLRKCGHRAYHWTPAMWDAIREVLR